MFRNVWRLLRILRPFLSETDFCRPSLTVLVCITIAGCGAKGASKTTRSLKDAANGSAVVLKQVGFTGAGFEIRISGDFKAISGDRTEFVQTDYVSHHISTPYLLSQANADALSSFLSKTRLIEYTGAECQKLLDDKIIADGDFISVEVGGQKYSTYPQRNCHQLEIESIEILYEVFNSASHSVEPLL